MSDPICNAHDCYMPVSSWGQRCERCQEKFTREIVREELNEFMKRVGQKYARIKEEAVMDRLLADSLLDDGT